MLNLLKKIMQTGTVTEEYFMSIVPARFRGQVMMKQWECQNCEGCIAACPTGALSYSGGKVAVNNDACIFCGQCVETCEKKVLRHSVNYELAHLAGPLAEEAAAGRLASKIRSVLGRSLFIRHVDVGSCNACDFEMSALLNPLYDLQHYGIDFVASPRHADLLMVTGVVTRNLHEALLVTYNAAPAPKLVMAVGACAASGKVFGDTYAIEGSVDKIIPVDIYVPGCPPRPQALIYGLLLALDRL